MLHLCLLTPHSGFFVSFLHWCRGVGPPFPFREHIFPWYASLLSIPHVPIPFDSLISGGFLPACSTVRGQNFSRSYPFFFPWSHCSFPSGTPAPRARIIAKNSSSFFAPSHRSCTLPAVTLLFESKALDPVYFVYTVS